MTDLPASWQPDPTGQHDHRYWDGTRWTEHVADAGVAAIDPYLEPTPPEPEPEPEPAAPARPAAPLTTGWAVPERTEPEPVAAEPVAAGPEPVAAEPEPVAAERAPAGWAGATEVAPSPDRAAAPISSGSTLPPPDAAGAGLPAQGGDGPDRRAKRNLLIGAVLVVVALLVVVLAIGGDDNDDSRSAVTARIADSLRNEDGISRSQADCIAEVIVDEVGLDRVKDVDFEADSPPKGDLGKDLTVAYTEGTNRCAGGGSPSGDTGTEGATDLGSATDRGAIADALGKQSESDLARQLSAQYQSMGLAADKADCLGGKMAHDLKRGDDAFGDFFDHLEACHATLDELGGSAP